MTGFPNSPKWSLRDSAVIPTNFSPPSKRFVCVGFALGRVAQGGHPVRHPGLVPEGTAGVGFVGPGDGSLGIHQAHRVDLVPVGDPLRVDVNLDTADVRLRMNLDFRDAPGRGAELRFHFRNSHKLLDTISLLLIPSPKARGSGGLFGSGALAGKGHGIGQPWRTRGGRK